MDRVSECQNWNLFAQSEVRNCESGEREAIVKISNGLSEYFSSSLQIVLAVKIFMLVLNIQNS